MAYYSIVSINFKGGVVPSGVLHKILVSAKKAQASEARISSRQQLILKVPGMELPEFSHALIAQKADFELDADEYPNIISSYPGAALFNGSTWLSEGIYQDILDAFDYRPQLKINIADNNQSFTPFFTGNLNFVASKQPNFWYLYVRFQKQNVMFCWDELVYTNDIPRISKAIEDTLSDVTIPKEKEAVTADVYQKAKYITIPLGEPLALPRFMLPYYEGFNRYGDKTWLGIYRRNESFRINFLIELCELCQQTKLGQMCLTNWRSLILKGIAEGDRMKWESLLGKHNINIRHAALELNWQFTEGDEQDFELKQFLVEELDRMDARTFGLCFAIKSKRKTEVFGSIIIRRRTLLNIGSISLFDVYDIKYRENFNPNSRKVYDFKRGVYKSELTKILLVLYKKYYEQLLDTKIRAPELVEMDLPEVKKANEAPLHQCPHCFTIYDPTVGDEMNHIKPGIPFDSLPGYYSCSVCEAPTSEFVGVSATDLS